MPDDHIRDWIEQKLEEGVSEERLRNVLEDSGRDPGIVDEVKDPFAEDQDRAEEDDNGLKYADSSEEDEEPETDEQDSSFLPSIDLSLPGFDIDFSRLLRYAKPAGAVIVAIALIYGGVTTFENGKKSTMTQEDVKQAASKGCPDVAVSINSVSLGERPVVSAEVSGGTASVVVEMRSDNEIVDRAYARFGGMKDIELSKTGDRVVLRPVNCYRIQDSVSLG